MGFLEAIVDGFIVTMGITPPTPEKKRVATIFIGTAMIASVVGVVLLFVFLAGHLLR